MRPLKQFVFSVTIFLALTGALCSQTSTTSLQGAVTDPSGSAISGASVVLSSNESKLERTMVTGMEGEYRFLALPPGTYTLTATAKGFSRYLQTDLRLLVNTPATANVQLKVGAVPRSSLSPEAPALNMVDASIGNSFQRDAGGADSAGRPQCAGLVEPASWRGLYRQSSGLKSSKDQDTRNGAVNGARSDQSNITLDGVDVNDQSNWLCIHVRAAGDAGFGSGIPRHHYATTTPTREKDRERRSHWSPRAARTASMARCTNIMRNTITSANDYFVKECGGRVGQPNEPLKLIRNIFGVSVGGPIQKDRLFFFANYEGTRQREEQSTVRTIPTPCAMPGHHPVLRT